MKRINTPYIVLLIAALSLVQQSCKKQLNLTPLDQLSDASFFQAPGDFKLFANQYYGWLKNFTTLDGILDNPHSDTRSDLFGGGGSFGAGTNTVPTTESNSGNAGNWVVDYSRIYAANYLLTKAAKY